MAWFLNLFFSRRHSSVDFCEFHLSFVASISISAEILPGTGLTVDLGRFNIPPNHRIVEVKRVSPWRCPEAVSCE